MSILDVKRAGAEIGRRLAPPPSLRDVVAAAQALTERGVAVMTLNELCNQIRAAGASWPRTTIKDVLNDEVVRPNSQLVRVRHGRYRLRDADDAPQPRGGNVAEHVVEAMRCLALKGYTRVIPQDIEAELVSMRLPYSLRAVRAGLLQLQRRVKPVVERTADGRYRLSPAGRGARS